MSDKGSLVTFIIVSFAFALVVIMKRETLPPPFKRPLAWFAIVLVALSFFFIVYSSLTL